MHHYLSHYTLNYLLCDFLNYLPCDIYACTYLNIFTLAGRHVCYVYVHVHMAQAQNLGYGIAEKPPTLCCSYFSASHGVRVHSYRKVFLACSTACAQGYLGHP